MVDVRLMQVRENGRQRGGKRLVLVVVLRGQFAQCIVSSYPYSQVLLFFLSLVDRLVGQSSSGCRYITSIFLVNLRRHSDFRLQSHHEVPRFPHSRSAVYWLDLGLTSCAAEQESCIN